MLSSLNEDLLIKRETVEGRLLRALKFCCPYFVRISQDQLTESQRNAFRDIFESIYYIVRIENWINILFLNTFTLLYISLET